MLLWSQTSLLQQLVTLFSVAELLVVVSQNPLCEQVATLRKRRTLCDLSRVLGKNEPEQFIENPWLTECQQSDQGNLLKTNDHAWGQIFCCQRTWIYR
jgi:hypothetical protein